MPYIMPQRARPRSPLGASLATGLSRLSGTGYPTRGIQPVQPKPPMPMQPFPAPGMIRAGLDRPDAYNPMPAPQPAAAPLPLPAPYAAPTFNVAQPANPVPPMVTGATDMFGSAPRTAPITAPMTAPMAGSQIGSFGTPTPITQGTGATAGFPYAGSDTNNGHPIFYNATAGMYVDSSGTAADPSTISNWQPNMDPRSINAANNPGGNMIRPGPGLAQGINALANPGNFGTAGSAISNFGTPQVPV